MAQHDQSIADQAGAAFRSDLNNALAALFSNNSGATEPAAMTAYMLWADTTSGWLKQRNAANNAWINRLKLADATTATGAALISAASVAAAQQAIDVEVGVDVQAFLVSGTNIKTISGSSILGSGDLSVGTSDQIARDQIALTNMRLMLNSAVTTGALVQGKQWELSTDEWGGTSTGETYTAGTPNYYLSGTSQSQTSGGTNLGTLTSGGGLAAAFDSTTSQALASSANLGGTGAITGYVGKDWGSGNTKTISSFTVYASSDNGFSNSGIVTSLTIKLQGSTDNFSSSIVDLYTDSAVAESNGASVDVTSGIATSTAYRYHRISVTENQSDAGGHTLGVAELKLYETVGSSEMTLIPPASVSVSAAPSYMDAYLLWKDDSGSAALGTDFTVELSRDNGTTYTTATLTNIGSFDGTYSVIKARVDVSAQPSGTSMLCRIKALNNKAQRVAAPALYAE